MVFQCINIRQVPWEVLKTAAFGLGFQHLPQDLANVNAWKTVFDPYIIRIFHGRPKDHCLASRGCLSYANREICIVMSDSDSEGRIVL